jgi:hypothetical protein
MITDKDELDPLIAKPDDQFCKLRKKLGIEGPSPDNHVSEGEDNTFSLSI